MYEPTYKLERKVRYGSESAKKEIKRRQGNYIDIGLKGINNEVILMVKTKNISEMLRYILNNIRLVDIGKSVEKSVILLDSYSSATIEGARTTVARVKEIINNKKYNLNKSEKMVLNSIKACNFAYENKIDIENIRYVFDTLTNGVCENESVKGDYFRNGDVFVGNEYKIIHTPCNVEDIQARMLELFNWLDKSTLNPILKSCIAHFYIVYIHPFCDGNGRLARLFNVSYLVNNDYTGFRKVSLSDSINSNIQDYYLKLEESEHNYSGNLDITPFLEYMLEMLCDSIDNTLQKYIKLSSVELSLVNKVIKNNEITVKKASIIAGKSENETRLILNKLSDMGYFSKTRIGNKNIYRRL